MTFHDSRVGKQGKVSKSKAPQSGTPVRPDTFPPAPATATCGRLWSSRNADVSRVGKHPPPGNRWPGLWGSGFSIMGGIVTCVLPNLTPVTCCTICRKLAGSAVINVVWDLFDARDFLFETLPPAVGGIVLRCRLGAAVSGSEPDSPETVGVCTVSGLINGEMVSESTVSVVVLVFETDFCRAFVSVSVSRANASEIQESAKVGLRLQSS